MAAKVTTIKERILQLTEIKKIAKEKFFAELGVSYGNFKGNSLHKALSSDTLADIVTKYPDVNVRWLLIGEGNPIDEDVKYNNSADVTLLNKHIALQDKHIARLERQLGVYETPDVHRKAN